MVAEDKVKTTSYEHDSPFTWAQDVLVSPDAPARDMHVPFKVSTSRSATTEPVRPVRARRLDGGRRADVTSEPAATGGRARRRVDAMPTLQDREGRRRAGRADVAECRRTRSPGGAEAAGRDAADDRQLAVACRATSRRRRTLAMLGAPADTRPARRRRHPPDAVGRRPEPARRSCWPASSGAPSR